MENIEMNHTYALADARNKNMQMPNAESSHPGNLHVPKNDKDDNYEQDDAGDSHSDRLNAARKGSVEESLKFTKNFAAMAMPMGTLSLLKQINLIGDMPYVAAMGAALLKDGLDLVDAETVLLPIVFSILCTIFIFMMMLLVGANGKKKGVSRFLSKIGILGVGGIADSIPGVDFFPIEILTVSAVYFMELVERRNMMKK